MRIHEEKGAALVEFAIVLPLLLLLTFGIIEFGLLMFNKAMITNASREAARAAIVFSEPPRLSSVQITDIVNSYCNAHLISFAASDPEVDVFTTDPTVTPLVESGYDPMTVAAGQYLGVRVNYDYSFLIFPNIVRLIGSTSSPTILLSSTAIMRSE